MSILTILNVYENSQVYDFGAGKSLVFPYWSQSTTIAGPDIIFVSIDLFALYDY